MDPVPIVYSPDWGTESVENSWTDQRKDSLLNQLLPEILSPKSTPTRKVFRVVTKFERSMALWRKLEIKKISPST